MFVTAFLNMVHRLDCSLNTPQIYSKAECDLFWEDDYTAGFRLLWFFP